MKAFGVLISGLLLFTASCGTIQYYSDVYEQDEHYPVYGGAKVVLGGRLIEGGPHGLCSGISYAVGLVDLPFSFAADTVLLPYSLPVSVMRYRQDAPLRQLRGVSDAIRAGDISGVRAYLDEGVHPDSAFEGECLYNRAAGHPEIQALLVSRGAKKTCAPAAFPPAKQN